MCATHTHKNLYSICDMVLVKMTIGCLRVTVILPTKCPAIIVPSLRILQSRTFHYLQSPSFVNQWHSRETHSITIMQHSGKTTGNTDCHCDVINHPGKLTRSLKRYKKLTVLRMICHHEAMAIWIERLSENDTSGFHSVIPENHHEVTR